MATGQQRGGQGVCCVSSGRSFHIHIHILLGKASVTATACEIAATGSHQALGSGRKRALKRLLLVAPPVGEDDSVRTVASGLAVHPGHFFLASIRILCG
jgi:hypothetical protein